MAQAHRRTRQAHLDPELLDLFFENLDEITAIQDDPDSFDVTVRSSVA
jgi:response regulator RpfG family c-di-GMP phosphodiesterase